MDFVGVQFRLDLRNESGSRCAGYEGGSSRSLLSSRRLITINIDMSRSLRAMVNHANELTARQNLARRNLFPILRPCGTLHFFANTGFRVVVFFDYWDSGRMGASRDIRYGWKTKLGLQTALTL